MSDKLETNFFSDMMTADERNRLDRQLRLPNWKQAAIKSASVLIVGVGGLGTEIAKNLAMIGVGTIHLVDMDTIEYTNLNRQILFSDGDEGEAKAKIAAKNLKKLNPHGNYFWHFTPLEDLDPSIYESVDFYISGLDSVTARKELIRRAVHNKKPLIDGGTATYYGHCYTYLPDRNACLECDPMREPEQESLAACTLVGIPRKRSHCLLKGQLYYESKHERPPDVRDESAMRVVVDYANSLVDKHFPGSEYFTLDDAVNLVDRHEPTVITINAVIASLQSQEAVKLIHHLKGARLGTVNDEYTIYNGLTGKFFYIPKPRNKKCQLCGPEALPIEHIEIPWSSTVNTVLQLLRSRGYDYDEEMPPGVYRIDTKDMYALDSNGTLQEQNLRSAETLYITGLTGGSEDIYLKISRRG